MIEKKTIVDQIEVMRNGDIQVRLGSLLIDGDQELDCKLHRFVLVPGGDVAGMLATVNSHLATLGRAELKDEAALSQLDGMVLLVHTREVVATYEASQKAVNQPSAGAATASQDQETRSEHS